MLPRLKHLENLSDESDNQEISDALMKQAGEYADAGDYPMHSAMLLISTKIDELIELDESI